MKKLFALLMTVVLVVSSLVGCSAIKDKNVTTESLLLELEELDQSHLSFDMDVALRLYMSLLGQEAELSMMADFAIESTENVAHIIGTQTTVEGDYVETEEVESWSEKLEDSIVTYTKADDMYIKQISDSIDMRTNISNLEKVIDPVLREETVEIGNSKFYVVDGTLDFANLGAMSEDMLAMSLDFSDVVVPVSYYFEETTHKLNRVNIECAEVLEQMIQEQMINELGFSLDLQILEFFVIMSNFEVIEEELIIPSEIIENAVMF